jgi:KDO2-lipid IV(A) lauroyltransferase
MRQLTDWLAYLLVRCFICLIQSIRLETCQAISRWLAVVACDVLRLRRSTVDENIRHVYPEATAAQRRRLTLQMWEHLLLMVCEVAQAPRKIHDTNWRQYVTLKTARESIGYMLDQRPIVLVSGHFGNFELTSYMIGMYGFPSYAIARPLDNRFLDRYINRFRSAYGQYILPKKGSSAQIDAVLRTGRAVALLGDQYAGPKGCWVDFLGRPASCHKAVALFTLVSGAPLMVCYGRRTGRPLQIELGAEGVVDPRVGGRELASVKSLTQWYNRALERIILRDPDQYWWLHRRWKGDPQMRRRKGHVRRDSPSSTAADRHAA